MKLSHIEKANKVARNALKAGVTLTYSEITCDAVDSLIEALRKAKKGLKYYADEKMWESHGGDDFYIPNSFECEKNEYGYDKARETLEQIEGILNHA